MKERIVLAYAGGLQASMAIPWLTEAYGAEIVTLTLDLGQGRDLEEIRDRARATGAVRAHVLDVREEFARDFVLPALQAGALHAGLPHDGVDPMAAALAWPLIAKTLLEIASIEQATAIAHGCIGKDQKRMDACARALNPDIRVIASTRAAGPAQSTYANLWGRGMTKSQSPEPKSQPSDGTPDTPAYVEISFERGVPAAINGVPMALTELIESLSIIAGQHGVGRIEAAGHAHEAPAAVILHAAHTALETLVLPREQARLKPGRAAEYADLVYSGLWFTPVRERMDAVNAEAQENVTGSVRIKLFKGTLLTSAAAELGAELDDAAVSRV